ncbi:hypothetical protein [Coleofasciculus sp. E2-BRE-01]
MLRLMNPSMNAIALLQQPPTSTQHPILSLENTAKRSEESL